MTDSGEEVTATLGGGAVHLPPISQAEGEPLDVECAHPDDCPWCAGEGETPNPQPAWVKCFTCSNEGRAPFVYHPRNAPGCSGEVTDG